MRICQLCCYAVACASMLVVPQASYAALIAHEPFLVDEFAPDAGAGEYLTDIDIRTQAPTVLGFSGPWTGTTSGFWARNNFLVPTNLPSSGGRLYFPGGSTDQHRHVERDLADYSGFASNTYYMSVTTRRFEWEDAVEYFNQGATVDPKLFLGLSNDAMDEGVFIGYDYGFGSATLFPVLVVRAGGVGQLASGVNSTFNDAFTTVMKLEVDVIGSQDRLSWYTAIGPGNTTPFADFTTEADAIATADFLGVIEAEIVSSQTAITELNVTSPTLSGITSFDEIRFATTWSEAVGVPEPASAPLAIGMAGLIFVGRRRK